jgi:hypothetical protein
MARVELAWLIRTGFLFVAAELVETQIRTSKKEQPNSRAAHGRLRFISMGSGQKFREQLPIPGEIVGGRATGVN